MSLHYATGALAFAAAAVLTQPAFAGAVTGPGPVAGIGLPALAIVGGVYWLGRKLLRPKQ